MTKPRAKKPRKKAADRANNYAAFHGHMLEPWLRGLIKSAWLVGYRAAKKEQKAKP